MTENDPLTFPDWLRRRRKAFDLTQDQLAKLLHCSVDMIRKIEAGDRRPSHETADLLAKALAVPLPSHERFVQIARMEPSLQQDEAIAAFSLLDSPSVQIPTRNGQRRIVAFLMCSLHDGAVLWERQPHPMRTAYADYRARLGVHVSAFQGAEVTTVDTATYTTFATIDDAIGAACAIQHLLQSTTWQEIGTLPVSLAIHIGLVDPSDPSAQAQALSLLTELCTIAHPGQILLSPAAQQIAAPCLADGYCIHDLGAYLLPSHTQREHIFQLDTPEGDAAFPPLRASGKPTHNLPTDLPPIIGRAQDVEEICAFFRQPHVRLLTLTGIGGIGKTRLAYAVAAELLPEFYYHVLFVSLAPLSDASFVLPTIAQVLGVSQSDDLTSAVIDHLTTRHMLLVLDNFEHVLDAAPMVSELLQAAPQLKVLATSRTRLNLHQEYAFPVLPLQVLPPSEAPEWSSMEQAQQSSAVTLFVQRAQMIQPRFALSQGNAATLSAICTHLDGIPLAIELAAARIATLPPAVLLERLRDRFALLTNGAVDRPSRQRTLRNTLDWSYNLLTPEEQVLLRRMGVFASGATADAITQAAPDLLAASDELKLLDALASLQRKSLLEQIDQGGQARFTMLETVRAYALDQLDAYGETECAWGWCAEHYCATLERIDPDFSGGQQEAEVNDLEHNNLRAVLGWALEAQDNSRMATAVRIASRLWRFWRIRGFLQEGREWLSRILERSDPAPSPYRANMYYGLGLLARMQGDLGVAESALQQSLAMWRVLDSPSGIASALSSLGVLCFNQCRYDHAEAYYQECAKHFHDLDQPDIVAIALNNLGNIAHKKGDLLQAFALYQQALHTPYEKSLSKQTIALIKSNLAEIARTQHEYLQAATWLRESVTLYEEIAHREGIVFCLENLADLAIDRAQPQLAAYILGATDHLYEQMHAVRTPEQAQDYLRQKQAIQQHLPFDDWMSSWSQGKATTTAQVLDHTFDQLMTQARQKGGVL